MLQADTDPQANPTASSGQKNADTWKKNVSDVPEAIMPEKDVLSENMILHHDEGVDQISGIIRSADIDRKLTGIFVKEKTD